MTGFVPPPIKVPDDDDHLIPKAATVVLIGLFIAFLILSVGGPP